MPMEKHCTWWGGGEAMKEHWTRVRWNLKHLLDFKSENPYHEDGRKAYQDILHSMVNIQVEFCRACPHMAGHMWYYENLALLAAVVFIWIIH